MTKLALPLYSWGNGAFIMIVIFGLVLAGLVLAVFYLMNNDKKKRSQK